MVPAARGRIAAAWACAASIVPKRIAGCGLTSRVGYQRRGDCSVACQAATPRWCCEVARSRSTTVPGALRTGEIVEVVTAGSGGYGSARRGATRKRCDAMSPKDASTTPPFEKGLCPIDLDTPLAARRRVRRCRSSRFSARAATTRGKLVFLASSSYPPTMAPWANAGTAAATAKLDVPSRASLGYDP